MNPIWIVDDNTPPEADPLFPGSPAAVLNGVMQSFGFVKRDVEEFPVYGASPVEIKTYSMKDWPALIKEKIASKSRCSDIRNRGGPDGGPIPFLNQGSWGYCWGHSLTHAVMVFRAMMELPYVALSAFSLCARIMNGANRGGWSALACDEAMKGGIAPQTLWPQLNANPRLWTPECQAEAAKFKVSEGWWDASKHPGLRKLTIPQAGTLLLQSIPVTVEYNDIAHSMLGLDLVDHDPSKDPEDPSRYAIDHLNSWLNYGVNGVGRRAGRKAWPDSCIALTSVNPV